MRRKIQRDKSHIAIMNGLKHYGYAVGDMAAVGGSFPDLIVSNNMMTTVVIEIKEPDGKISIGQLEFLSTWKGYAGFATTLDEARSLMSDPKTNCLTAAQKDKIAGIALRYRSKTKAKYPQISVKLFDTLMR